MMKTARAVHPPVRLSLGYADDDYHDNGYDDHDVGTDDQCAGTGPAWVEITIRRERPPPEIFISPDEAYRLLSVATGKVITPDSTLAIDALAQKDYAPNAASQKWQLTPLLPRDDANHYRIRNLASGKCLDVVRLRSSRSRGFSREASVADGAGIIQTECNSSQSQMWRLVPAGRARAFIMARHSGKVATVSDATAGIAQSTLAGNDGQRWSLLASGRP